MLEGYMDRLIQSLGIAGASIIAIFFVVGIIYLTVLLLNWHRLWEKVGSFFKRVFSRK